MAWYKTGTISIQSGQTSLTGVGTKFASNSKVGDGFRGPNGEWYEIVNIASETVIGIFPAYTGTTVSNSSNWMIAPLQGYNQETATRLRSITDSINDVGTSVVAAKASADAAKVSENNAKTSETNANTRANAALVSQNAAKVSENNAKTSETNAKTSETTAKTYADQAASSIAVPLSTRLTGLSTSTYSVVNPNDTILTGFGKLQAQNSLSGWGVPGFKSSPTNLNAMELLVNQTFTIDANTTNKPFKFGSSTVTFDAGSAGWRTGYSDSTDDYHWAMMVFDRSSGAICYRRMNSKTIQPDDYLVIYPTGKTFLDISQGGTGANSVATAKVNFGINNVDNTSDLNKPISTATQTALNTKLGTGSNAVSATRLATARTINGVSFDGTANITLPNTSTWGSITGSLSSQTDLVTELSKYQLKSDIIPANQIIAVGTFTTAAPPVLTAATNVTSVTRVGVGIYNINMSRTLKAGFKVIGFTGGRGGSSYIDSFLVDWTTTGSGNVSTIRVLTVAGTTLVDPNSAPTQFVIVGEFV